jgi:hypothetical protein
MKVLPLTASALMLVLAACGTPQEQCISAVTRDLRVVDGLIKEAQGNLARGYAYEDVVKTIPQYVDCTPKPTEADPKPKPQMCLVDVAETVQKPVAIDLVAEQQKLDSLLTKRAAMAQAASPSIALCQQQYPE